MPSAWCCCADTAAAAAAAALPRGWRPALVEATPGLGPADKSDRSSPPAAAAVVMWLAVVRWLRAGWRRVAPGGRGGEGGSKVPVSFVHHLPTHLGTPGGREGGLHGLQCTCGWACQDLQVRSHDLA
jgi:hypothetical protein